MPDDKLIQDLLTAPAIKELNVDLPLEFATVQGMIKLGALAELKPVSLDPSIDTKFSFDL